MLKYKILTNGLKIPFMGIGTIVMDENAKPILADVYNLVVNAIKCGYRLIDTAESYDNEEAVGKAINYCIDNNIVKREELFITTKLSIHKPISYNRTKKAFNESLQKLGLDYVDLYLLHGPGIVPDSRWKQQCIDAWHAIEELYEEGLTKSIGVSNFMCHHLEMILEKAKIKPMVNQIELNPVWQQKEVVKLCKENNIILEAWSPLRSGAEPPAEIVKELSQKYSKTIAQIYLKWSLQKGFVPLPKTTNINRMKENMDLDGFKISDDDLHLLDSLNSHPLGRVHPDAYWTIYIQDEELRTKTIKEYWKLFGKINLFEIKMKDMNAYVYYLFGCIPLFKKYILSKEEEKICFCGFPILNIQKRRKLFGLNRIPKGVE